VTPDGVARVVYRGADTHIYELSLEGGWFQADLLSAFFTDPFPAAAQAGQGSIARL